MQSCQIHPGLAAIKGTEAAVDDKLAALFSSHLVLVLENATVCVFLQQSGHLCDFPAVQPSLGVEGEVSPALHI